MYFCKWFCDIYVPKTVPPTAHEWEGPKLVWEGRGLKVRGFGNIYVTNNELIMSSTAIWIIMIAVMVLSMIIQNMLQSRFKKYSEVPLGMTGAEVASRMLAAHGIRDGPL